MQAKKRFRTTALEVNSFSFSLSLSRYNFLNYQYISTDEESFTLFTLNFIMTYKSIDPRRGIACCIYVFLIIQPDEGSVVSIERYTNVYASVDFSTALFYSGDSNPFLENQYFPIFPECTKLLLTKEVIFLRNYTNSTKDIKS